VLCGICAYFLFPHFPISPFHNFIFFIDNIKIEIKNYKTNISMYTNTNPPTNPDSMNKMLIALIYYVNTYPFNEISCTELPKEFAIETSMYSLYYYINLILDEIITVDDIPSTLASTFIIINKLIMKGIRLHINNQHKLLVVCIMISSKLLQDDYYSNTTWAENVDIPIKDLNKMERDILKIIDYDLYMSKEVFDTTLKILLYIPVNRAIRDINSVSEVNMKMTKIPIIR